MDECDKKKPLRGRFAVLGVCVCEGTKLCRRWDKKSFLLAGERPSRLQVDGTW